MLSKHWFNRFVMGYPSMAVWFGLIIINKVPLHSTKLQILFNALVQGMGTSLCLNPGSCVMLHLYLLHITLYTEEVNWFCSKNLVWMKNLYCHNSNGNTKINVIVQMKDMDNKIQKMTFNKCHSYS